MTTDASVAAGTARASLFKVVGTAWNAGCAAVIGGTLMRVPLVADGGSLLLVVALALTIRSVRGRAAKPARALGLPDRTGRHPGQPADRSRPGPPTGRLRHRP